jgi:hypothetical protein
MKHVDVMIIRTLARVVEIEQEMDALRQMGAVA